MRILAALLIMLAVTPALAAITVTDGWVRAMPPGAKNSAGYLEIRNPGGAADELLGARIDGVRVTELHEMVDAGDGTKYMQHRNTIAVPASGHVLLAPGGLHLMLIDLQRPLQAGEKLGGTLHFRKAGEVKVEMEVRMP
ncbi:MAG: copper chaperone PCu(A)C [Pseudomonadota bacterium]